jgi:hypothetical protein
MPEFPERVAEVAIGIKDVGIIGAGDLGPMLDESLGERPGGGEVAGNIEIPHYLQSQIPVTGYLTMR